MSRNTQDMGMMVITKFELLNLNFVLTCHSNTLLSSLGKQQYDTTEISNNFILMGENNRVLLTLGLSEVGGLGWPWPSHIFCKLFEI